MSFGDYVKKGWEVVQLKKEAIKELAADEKAFGPAIGIIALSGVAMALGMLNWPGIVFFPIMRLVGAFVFVAIIHFAATAFFGGKGQFKEVFSPLGCAVLISWIGVIPFLGTVLGVLAGLWLLVVAVVVVEEAHQIERPKAIAVVAIPVVLFLIIAGITAAIVGLTALALIS